MKVNNKDYKAIAEIIIRLPFKNEQIELIVNPLADYCEKNNKIPDKFTEPFKMFESSEITTDEFVEELKMVITEEFKGFNREQFLKEVGVSK